MYTTAKQMKSLAVRVSTEGLALGVSARGEVGTRMEWVAKFRSHGAAETALEKAGFTKTGGLWCIVAV